MRSIMTGEALDTGCNLVRARIGAALFNKMEQGQYVLFTVQLIPVARVSLLMM